MSHTDHSQPEITKLVHRLKTRLALANFKREHGLENIDLSTLELNLMFDTKQPVSTQKSRKRRTPQHRFYPTSPPPPPHDQLVNRHVYRAGLSTPVSEQRSTSPKLRTATPLLDRNHSSFSSDDEDAAHLLVMMHHSPNLLS
ncbi:hypothetical protein K501DRAFT_338542 [Backusella circina FSU 941]|nr:hypothetical protein K501DRAFT_338542 [Backusella circina FSU 941]